MAAWSALRKTLRSVAVRLVWAAVFFLLGYFCLTLARDVRVCLVILAAVIIPFGVASRSVLGGLLRGGGLGLATGAGIIWGMLVTKPVPPGAFDRTALTYAVSAVVLASAVAALFAILAQRRRRLTQQSWGD